MAENDEVTRAIINLGALPSNYPTQLHSSEFWEALGRTVATFGFLEEILGKAIFAFTGTKEYSDEDIADALEKWLPTLEQALYRPLGNLIDLFVKSIRENQSATIENIEDLETNLREASALRNVLCHGSWRKPDNEGASVPFFVNNKMMVFNSPVDVAFLRQTQVAVCELACAVVNTVTHMGFQFPGGAGPGKSIWTRQ